MKRTNYVTATRNMPCKERLRATTVVAAHRLRVALPPAPACPLRLLGRHTACARTAAAPALRRR